MKLKGIVEASNKGVHLHKKFRMRTIEKLCIDTLGDMLMDVFNLFLAKPINYWYSDLESSFESLGGFSHITSPNTCRLTRILTFTRFEKFLEIKRSFEEF